MGFLPLSGPQFPPWSNLDHLSYSLKAFFFYLKNKKKTHTSLDTTEKSGDNKLTVFIVILKH